MRLGMSEGFRVRGGLGIDSAVEAVTGPIFWREEDADR
jgi:hypothetical protein